MTIKATNDLDRRCVAKLIQIPNVGPATVGDFNRLGITKPQQLIGKDAFELFDRLCRLDGHQHDPCVIDVFMSAVDFMDGNEARNWWDYTMERKSILRARKGQ